MQKSQQRTREGAASEVGRKPEASGPGSQVKKVFKEKGAMNRLKQGWQVRCCKFWEETMGLSSLEVRSELDRNSFSALIENKHLTKAGWGERKGKKLKKQVQVSFSRNVDMKFNRKER